MASIKTLLQGFGNSDFRATAGGVALINWFLDEFLQLITTSACDDGLDAKHLSASIQALFPESNLAQNLVEYAGYGVNSPRFGLGSGVDFERRRGIYSPRTVFESLRAMSLHCGALGKRTDRWRVTQLARELIPAATALFASRVLEHVARSIVVSALLQLQQMTRTHQQLVEANVINAPAPDKCLDHALVMLALASDPQLAKMSAKIGFRSLVECSHTKPSRQAKSTIHRLSQIDALVEPPNRPPEPVPLSQRILNKLRFLKPRPDPPLQDDAESIYAESRWSTSSASVCYPLASTSLEDPSDDPADSAFEDVIRSSVTQRITLTPSRLRFSTSFPLRDRTSA